ncbi:hypothetical protein OH77DRAFT_1380198, partial [Trametes cingulata]
KRDQLRKLQNQYRARWAEKRIFEVNAPTLEGLPSLSRNGIRQRHPKWFGTFPYPYTDGSLHLGHAYTIFKIELAAGFRRMMGERVL